MALKLKSEVVFNLGELSVYTDISERRYGLYKKGNIWAEPDIEHAVELMRLGFYKRDYALSIAKNEEKFIKDKYNAQLIGKKIKVRLDIILKVI